MRVGSLGAAGVIVIGLAAAGCDRLLGGDEPGAAVDADPNAPDADPSAPDADPSAPDADPSAPDATPGGGPDAATTCTNPVWVQLLDDPAFDEGSSAWSQDPGFLIVPLGGGLPDTPPNAVWMGNGANAQRVWQQVTIPADARALRLRGKWRMSTLEFNDTTSDSVTFELKRGTSTVATLLVVDAGDARDTWTAFNVDAPQPFAGDAIDLSIRGVFDGDSATTHIFVDTLAFEAELCP